MMEDGGAEALPEIDSHPACTSPERKQKNDIKGQNETKHLNFEFSNTNRQRCPQTKLMKFDTHTS